MKQTIIRIVKAIFFLSMTIAVLLAGGFFLRPVANFARMFPYYYELEENSIDVLLIGASGLYRYWIPTLAYEQEGFTSAMLSGPAQVPPATPTYIEEGLKTQEPDLVIIEPRRFVEYAEKLNKYGEVTYRTSKNDYLNLTTLSGMNFSIEKYKLLALCTDNDFDVRLEYLFPLLKYHDNLLEEPMTELIRRVDEDPVEFMSRLQNANIESQTPFSRKKEKDKIFPDTCKQLLDDAVETAAKYGKKVLFVSTPFSANASEQTMIRQMHEYMDEKGYDNLNMVFLADEIGLDFRTDYCDRKHSNIAGAEKITSYLAEYLSEHYDFSSEMTEKEQSYWDKAMAIWKEHEEVTLKQWEKNVKKLDREEAKAEEEAKKDETE